MEVQSLPDKTLFRFEEVANLTGIRPYVLRFWETEFEQISPSTSFDGEKVYEKTDIETILEIKKLLFEHKLSIPKAKQLLTKSLIMPSSPRVIEEEAEINEEEGYSRHKKDERPGDKNSMLKARSILRNSLTFINIIKKRKNWLN